MRLEDHRGRTYQATPMGVAQAIQAMTEVGSAYVILGDDRLGDEHYVQAAGTQEEGGFVVERRDGCAGERYRGDRRLHATELVVMLGAYLQGAPGWSHAISWHRICVDIDREHPSA